MSTDTRIPSDSPTSGPSQPRTARLITRLAVAAPVALSAAVFIHPHDTSDAAATLQRIAGDDRARWTAAHLLEPFSWLLLALVLLAAARVATTKGRRLIQVGAVVAAAGAAATALVVYSHGEAYRFMTEPGMNAAAMEELYVRFYDGIPLAGLFSALFRPGMLLLGIGFFRSRVVPAWAAALVALTPLVMLPLAQAPPAVGAVAIGVPLVAGLAGCARAIGAAAAGATR
jgi:hypothetical protein